MARTQDFLRSDKSRRCVHMFNNLAVILITTSRHGMFYRSRRWRCLKETRNLERLLVNILQHSSIWFFSHRCKNVRAGWRMCIVVFIMLSIYNIFYSFIYIIYIYIYIYIYTYIHIFKKQFNLIFYSQTIKWIDSRTTIVMLFVQAFIINTYLSNQLYKSTLFIYIH